MYGGSSFCLPKIDNGLLLATWQTKVFELLLAAGKIDQQTVDEMRTWPHSGFSVDNSVYLPAYDTAALQRLAQYILRCPFSLARRQRHYRANHTRQPEFLTLHEKALRQF